MIHDRTTCERCQAPTDPVQVAELAELIRTLIDRVNARKAAEAATDDAA